MYSTSKWDAPINAADEKRVPYDDVLAYPRTGAIFAMSVTPLPRRTATSSSMSKSRRH